MSAAPTAQLLALQKCVVKLATKEARRARAPDRKAALMRERLAIMTARLARMSERRPTPDATHP